MSSHTCIMCSGLRHIGSRAPGEPGGMVATPCPDCNSFESDLARTREEAVIPVYDPATGMVQYLLSVAVALETDR